MRREDLFIAIGAVGENRLAQCEKAMNPSEVLCTEDALMQNKKHIRTFILIAAIISLMLLLMGSAISALVKMRVEAVKTFAQSGTKPSNEQITVSQDTEREEGHSETFIAEEPAFSETIYEGEKINFDQIHDGYIELGPYYPQEIPEGYAMTFVSDGAPLQSQVIHYENGAGGLIRFWIYIGNPASSAEIYGIIDRKDITVAGKAGLLYEQQGGVRTIVWLSEKQGYGFVLTANDPSVDILAMAESTAEGEYLVPTRSEKTVEALQELGDFSPEYLPEGYAERGLQGAPLSEGGWYSYVRKWYINTEENKRIYFEYESYVIVTEDGYTDDARTICSFSIPGYHILKGETAGEETEINGMFGIMTAEHIVWADPQTHRVFHLYSEDVTGEELLQVAKSISEKS